MSVIVDQPKHIDCLAVDADIVAFRVSAVNEMATLKQLRTGIDEFIFNIARDTCINRMGMFLSDSTNFRYDIAKTIPYKHNRYNKDGEPKVPKPRLLTNAKEYIKEKYRGYVEFDHEADDCIASFMTLNENVAHAGIDKDIRQVHGYHYNFVKRIWEYTSKEESALMLWRQVCTGDYGDGIPGLQGIGPGKASKAVTNHEYAKDQAYALYCERMKGHSELEVAKYFEEQTNLIRMVEGLVISYDHTVIINPPKLFEPDEEEGGWMGFDVPTDNLVLE